MTLDSGKQRALIVPELGIFRTLWQANLVAGIHTGVDRTQSGAQLTRFTVTDCVREASRISVEYSECNLNGSRSQQ
jgi:hypothetical protein